MIAVMTPYFHRNPKIRRSTCSKPIEKGFLQLQLWLHTFTGTQKFAEQLVLNQSKKVFYDCNYDFILSPEPKYLQSNLFCFSILYFFSISSILIHHFKLGGFPLTFWAGQNRVFGILKLVLPIVRTGLSHPREECPNTQMPNAFGHLHKDPVWARIQEPHQPRVGTRLGCPGKDPTSFYLSKLPQGI